MSRRAELLTAYRETLERMEVPLTRDWLVEHEVTADEVHQLVQDVLARLTFPEDLAEAMTPERSSTWVRCESTSPTTGLQCTMKYGHPGRHGRRGADYWGPR